MSLLTIYYLINFLLETYNAHGMNFKSKRSGRFHNLSVLFSPGNKYVEKLAGGISWYIMKTINFISNINFEF